jgi:hypothetical protein
MKKYLLTWYGMSDLRAATGDGDSIGPILSALKTGLYTDVIILGYTAIDKVVPDSLDPFEISNTEKAHNVFISYIKTQLSTLNLSVDINFISVELSKLNDSEGIYNAAMNALQVTVADNSNEITLYISPGTPVMAYSWALIAQFYPQIGIKIISSSNPVNPPEQVDFGKHSIQASIADVSNSDTKFDAVIHLLGDQKLPILFAIRQFEPKKNYIITTSDYQGASQRLSSKLGVSSSVKIIEDPFKPKDTRLRIEEILNKLPLGSKVAVNLTGGTKIMFAGALDACRQRNLTPFYFEIKDHNIIFLNDGSRMPYKGSDSVDDFFLANDSQVNKSGNPSTFIDSRKGITEKLFLNKKAVGTLYQSAQFRDKKTSSKIDNGLPFEIETSKTSVSFSKNSISLVLNGEDYEIEKYYNDFGVYIAGGWFEEYLYNCLKPLQDDGLIFDIRIGITFKFNNPPSNISDKFNIKQEFDVVFTDGKRLWILECKAGAVKQEHVQKLENNLRNFGGIAAKGIMISSFEPQPAIKARINESKSVQLLYGDEINTQTFRNMFATEFKSDEDLADAVSALMDKFGGG